MGGRQEVRMQPQMLYLEHFEQIGLDTDTAVKLNCDEAQESKWEATQKRVGAESKGDNQGQRLYSGR